MTQDRRHTYTALNASVSYKDGGNKAFEAGSDEDLLGSNFDRMSRILPNHEQINQQLPDFNNEESVGPPIPGKQ